MSNQMVTRVHQKKGKEVVWEPIQAQRKRKMFIEDGRSMLQKAQDLKRKCNLEIPHGNSIIPSKSVEKFFSYRYC
jgi:hypothetical protein